jgi:hypothetical protein
MMAAKGRKATILIGLVVFALFVAFSLSLRGGRRGQSVNLVIFRDEEQSEQDGDLESAAP